MLLSKPRPLLARCVQETTEADLEPLEHLSASLVSLSLRHCWALSDGGLSALAPLTCLGLLDLFGCQRITEEGLTALADLPLRSLDVGRCGIGSLGPVAALQGLRTLGLSYCRGLGDRHLAALAPLAASLTSLDVFECTGLTDEAGAELAALTGLRELHLAIGDTLTDEGVQHLRPLTCLRVLNLYATGVTHSALEALAPALSGTLEVLNLDKTLASSDEGIEALAPALAGTLTSLSLAHGLVTDSGLRAVRRMHLLRTLSLRGNSYVTDAGVRELGCLPLTSLDLSFCHGVSASGLEELPASLEELSLEGCHEITGDAFRPLGRLNRLRLLNLEMCDGVHGIEDGIDELLNAADGSLEVIL